MATLNSGGASSSDSALMLLPSLKDDTSSEPRMLTRSEIDWLKQNKKISLDKLLEMAKVLGARQQAA